MNWLPLSDSTVFSIPYTKKQWFTKECPKDVYLLRCSGTVRVIFVTRSVITQMNRFPILVRISFLNMSIEINANGSVSGNNFIISEFFLNLTLSRAHSMHEGTVAYQSTAKEGH